jgi:cytochrome c oxidase accessory protein FixG
MSGPIPAPERVLPTLNADGTRRLIRPKLSSGRYHRWRLVVGWGLILTFALIPFLKLNGRPLILLDLPAREFTFFGTTLLATDGVVLMLFLLSAFVAVIGLTALIGRAWCGWGCPQTVYMELLYRPIERWFEGDRAAQLRLDKVGGGWRRTLKNVAFAVVSVGVANVFLAYFVGVERLAHWMTQSPLTHPTGFLVMSATAGLMFFDFAWFREQMCTVICPYARLQSVLLDKRSLVIGYDDRRGEPRGRGKLRPGDGDCIDCSACVTTCPTGIDIREGLQLECVACAQCVDACDGIMQRIGKPPGLIRYGLAGDMERPTLSKMLRLRVIVYFAIFVVLSGALFLVARRLGGFDATVLRGIGAPYVEQPDGRVRNQLRVKVENRGTAVNSYRIELVDAPMLVLVAPQNPLPVSAGVHETTTIFVSAPEDAFENGSLPIRVRLTDDAGKVREVPYKLLGPVRGTR